MPLIEGYEQAEAHDNAVENMLQQHEDIVEEQPTRSSHVPSESVDFEDLHAFPGGYEA